MRFINKKTGIVAVVLAAILAVSGVAYAYWTSTGSGTGSGTMGTAADNLYTTGTVQGLLYPDGPARDVTFTVANPSNFDQQISNIHLVSVSGTGCLNADFTMPDVPINPAGGNGDIQANATAQSVAEIGHLTYHDTPGVSQDACKNTVLTLTFSTT